MMLNGKSASFFLSNFVVFLLIFFHFSASSPEFPQPSSLKDGPMSHGTENGTSTPRFGNKLSSSQSRLHERSPLSRDDSDHEHGGHLPRQPQNGHVDHKALSSQNASQKDGSRSLPSVPQGDGNVKENHAADHISVSTHLRVISRSALPMLRAICM